MIWPSTVKAVWDEHLPAEERNDVLGQHRLAVARRPEQEERPAGVHRLTHCVHDMVLEDQVGQRFANLVRPNADRRKWPGPPSPCGSDPR